MLVSGNTVLKKKEFDPSTGTHKSSGRMIFPDVWRMRREREKREVAVMLKKRMKPWRIK
jgi:hypothetical protein